MGLWSWLFGEPDGVRVKQRSAQRRRFSVHVGINDFAGSPENALRGCVNDARNMHRFCVERGYSAREAVTNKWATKDNLLLLIRGLLHRAEPAGDVLISWSSHGTRVADPREADGVVEALVPHDGMLDWPRNLVTAYDLAALLREAEDVRVLLVIDACHSGINPADTGLLTRSVANPHNYRKARSLVSGHEAELPAAPRVTRSIAAPGGEWRRTALLSGAATHETAADAWIDGSYQGALTSALIAVAKRNPGASLYDLHRAALASVAVQYGQTPQLQGPAELTRAEWL